jgi:uncharacterized protein (TIGR02246 family)
MRGSMTVIALLTLIASPVLAQDTSADAKAQAEQLSQQYDQLWMKGDAAELVKLFTKDVVFYSPAGPKLEGQAAIQKAFEQRFKSPHIKHKSTVEKAEASTGDPKHLFVIGDWEATGANGQVKGHWAAMEKMEGGALRIHMLVASLIPQEQQQPMVGSSSAPAK